MFLKIVLDSGFENFENTILELVENSSCFLNSIYIYIYIYIYIVFFFVIRTQKTRNQTCSPYSPCF